MNTARFLAGTTVVLCALLLPAEVFASHLRFAEIRWERDDSSTRTITVHMRLAERHTYLRRNNSLQEGSPYRVSVYMGDGRQAFLNGTVTYVNTDEDWFVAEVSGQHTYGANVAEPITVTYSTCCTLGTLENAPNARLEVSTRVSLATGNLGSPRSMLEPIIRVRPGTEGVRLWGLPAHDDQPSTDSVTTWTWPEGVVAKPPEFELTATNGMQLSVSGPRMHDPGLWLAAARFTDQHGDYTTVAYPVELQSQSYCDSVVALADGYSTSATRNHAPNESFSREQYQTLFEAVECRTGVPARLLKVIAFSEGLGNQYRDATPRHFIEPCHAHVHTNGQFYFRLFGPYYGRTKPLIGLGRSFYGNESGLTTAPLYPWDDATAGIPEPTPEDCSLPPPTQEPWDGVWDTIRHVTIGDDGQYGPRLGIGIMQLTFDKTNVNRKYSKRERGDASTLLAYGTWARADEWLGRSFYPHGAGQAAPPATDFPPMDSLRDIIEDPQLNILVYAELILWKFQHYCVWEGSECISTPKPNAGDITVLVSDTQYHDILVAGPDAPDSEDAWIAAVAQGKTIPGEDQEGVQNWIGHVLETESELCTSDVEDTGCIWKRTSYFANPRPPAVSPARGNGQR